MRISLSVLVASLAISASAARAADTHQLIAEKCAHCHGNDGLAGDPETPRLAGLNAAYLAKQIRAFVDGQRRHDDMAKVSATLSESETQAVAAWYATKKPSAAKTQGNQRNDAGRQVYEEGNGDLAVTPCITCHQPDGLGNARFPRLAGQPKAYLSRQMSEFKPGRRTTDPQMTTIAQHLSKQETQALADYLSGL